MENAFTVQLVEILQGRQMTSYLTQMLMTEIKPHVPGRRSPKKIHVHSNHNVENANIETHKRAMLRYWKAFKDEWNPTRVIEERMGMSRSSALPTLVDWMGKELVVRRPLGDRPYNRRSGWEWRWSDATLKELTELAERSSQTTPELSQTSKP